MDLSDGLREYQSGTSYATTTLQLELDARSVLDLLQQYGDTPPLSALGTVKQFLVEVEAWKANCDQQRMVNAQQNPDHVVWEAFRGAVQAGTDKGKLLSIMDLKGFGSFVDAESGKRRAKVATAVLRFLWPERWGVVDWRVAVMRGLLDKHGWNVDVAIAEAKRNDPKNLRAIYDLMDENDACELK